MKKYDQEQGQLLVLNGSSEELSISCPEHIQLNNYGYVRHTVPKTGIERIENIELR
jgi:hypothetical protein